MTGKFNKAIKKFDKTTKRKNILYLSASGFPLFTVIPRIINWARDEILLLIVQQETKISLSRLNLFNVNFTFEY